MGVIAAQDKMPSAKFVNPPNGATIPASQTFTITVAIRNMELGHFTNPATTSFLISLSPFEIKHVMKVNLGAYEPRISSEYHIFIRMG